MPHPRQHIRDLAEICKRRKIGWVVISPGSRSAPLIQVFYDAFGEDCISIVDERSAGYVALGIALHTQMPVALICTSGTAVLNYAPALAEAYYQNVPLLAITADRPHEWIDQQDNQTLHQKSVYRNFIKRSIEIPQYVVTDDDLWLSHRLVNEALNDCTRLVEGPVHINVPLTEPLYDEIPPPSDNIRIIPYQDIKVSVNLAEELIDEWKKAKRIMIIHGQDVPGNNMTLALKPFLNDPRVIVVAENIANIGGENILTNSNLTLSMYRGKSPEFPDLILHSGGQVVSKALTGYLRRANSVHCWRIGNDENIIDTFKHANRLLPLQAPDVYNALTPAVNNTSPDNYREIWLNMSVEATHIATERIKNLPFTDVHVFKNAMELIPDNALLFLGNSSVIRYSQLFANKKALSCFSNRGTSGIDGCLSSAVGIAIASKKLTIALVGDMGFLYDSNALWNKELPASLRILVINNQGGGIFHILKGPSEQPGFKKFIEAHHPVNIAKLAEAYGLRYLYAGDEKTIIRNWPDFTGVQQTAVVFEVKTDAATSAQAFRKLMASS